MSQSSLHRRVKRTNRKLNRTNRKLKQTNRKLKRTNRKVKRRIKRQTNRKLNNRRVKRTNRKVKRRIKRRTNRKVLGSALDRMKPKKFSGGSNTLYKLPKEEKVEFSEGWDRLDVNSDDLEGVKKNVTTKVTEDEKNWLKKFDKLIKVEKMDKWDLDEFEEGQVIYVDLRESNTPVLEKKPYRACKVIFKDDPPYTGTKGSKQSIVVKILDRPESGEAYEIQNRSLGESDINRIYFPKPPPPRDTSWRDEYNKRIAEEDRIDKENLERNRKIRAENLKKYAEEQKRIEEEQERKAVEEARIRMRKRKMKLRQSKNLPPLNTKVGPSEAGVDEPLSNENLQGTKSIDRKDESLTKFRDRITRMAKSMSQSTTPGIPKGMSEEDIKRYATESDLAAFTAFKRNQRLKNNQSGNKQPGKLPLPPIS